MSVKKNYIYNTVNVISSLLFPLITFPYVSRVIMAEGIGQVQFFSSIINYVILLTSIGIPMYGIREIARVRESPQRLCRTTAEIILLNLILCIAGYIIVAVLCFTVAKIQINIPLFLLLSTTIILTTIGCPWFYQGIEDFKYVTLSGLIVRILSIAFLFIFVRSSNDIMWYAGYTIAASTGSYIINFSRLRKHLDFKCLSIKDLNILQHLKPALTVFIFNLVASIYLNLDTVMLGFIKEPDNVGYYTAASRLSHMLVMLVTSLGTVMLPRLSNLASTGDTENFKRLASKSYNFVAMIALPICLGLIVLAPSLIRLFSGDAFLPAIPTLKIMAPITIAIGISNLIGLQILYPIGKIKIVTISTCIGAAVNFTLNCLLIPSYAQDGAAAASVAAEISVTIAQLVFARRYIPIRLLNKNTVLYTIASIVMYVACVLTLRIGENDITNIILIPTMGAIIYGSILLFCKETLSTELVYTIKAKIHRAS